jgi:hypothetical protein
MDNVIYLNKFKKEHTKKINSNSNANRYLQICKDTLVSEDYHDLLKAIDNSEFYNKCDIEIQDLVDGYFKQLNKIY